MQLSIDSCPHLPDPAVLTPTLFDLTTVYPPTGINDNLEFEISEANEIEGKFVIAYFEDEILKGTDGILMNSWFEFFQNEGAIGLIYTHLTDIEGNYYSNCDDIVYAFAESELTQFTSSEPISIPIIKISPSDMRTHFSRDTICRNRVVRFYPKGVEAYEGLPTILEFSWEENSESCDGGLRCTPLNLRIKIVITNILVKAK